MASFARNFARRVTFRGAAGFTGLATATATTSFVCCRGYFSKGEPTPFDYKAVRGDIAQLLEDDLTWGPLLVRLAWHEAGKWDSRAKNGCPNSASMRFAPECNYGANAGLLKARDFLEQIKKKHPKISYADLWSLAACVAIQEMGGPEIEWRFGRQDATKCENTDGRLPDASQGKQHVRDVFTRMGFNDRETVALIGAHTLGGCHKDRSGYDGDWTFDPVGFDNSFFSSLIDTDWVVDKNMPDKLQFRDAPTKKLMMLPADIALLHDASYRQLVEEYAKSQEGWQKDFAVAFQKLMELGVENQLKYPA